MSQFGMQMPAGRLRRGPSLDTTAVLLALACASLVAACVVMYMSASSVGKGGNFWELQEPGRIELPKAGA